MEQKQAENVTEQPMPGDRLRSAREEQSLTIKSVAQTLNLSSDFISLIERNEFASLPASVYLKGYVRMYAKLLHLDDQRIIAELNQCVDASDLFPERGRETNYVCPMTLSAPSPIMLKRKKQSKRRKWLAALLITALSAATIYVIGQYYSNTSHETRQPVPQNKHIDFT